jgi:hypothetical protein
VGFDNGCFKTPLESPFGVCLDEGVGLKLLFSEKEKISIFLS